MTCPPCLRGISLVLLLAAAAPAALAGHKEDIGLTALLAELGGSAPTGAGITVSQVEGGYPTSSNFVADVSDVELLGKNVTIKSSPSGLSGHATYVARSYCGSANGIAPGMTQIDAYYAISWLQSDFLKWEVPGYLPPLVENRRIQNHSWC